jgi:multidrug efflux pump subunit AcrB
MDSKPEKIGLAGKIALGFIHSKLTPVLAVFSILIGLAAVFLTPKEEEPQISVPMIDISIGDRKSVV